MESEKATYILCPRYKGQPRKHVSVCEACRYRKKCLAFLRFLQPELPFTFTARAPGQ